MSDQKSVFLNGQGLHGNDRLGHWRINQLEGWGGSPPVRSQDVERPGADGDYDLPTYYGARPVTLGGRVICTSEAAAIQARNRLTGLVRGLVRLQIADQGETTWADVKLSDLVDATRKGRLVRFQYQLRAPDSRKYGNTKDFIRTNGVVATFHRGNYDAHPTIVVRGTAANGYRLNGPDGKQYRVSRALDTGIPHRIEFTDGLLRVDGVLVSTGVDQADVWPIPAGQSVDFDINVLNGGTAEATITVTDTYI